MKVVLLDGYNLLYRSYHSSKRFSKGKDWGFVYQFFRSLRPLIEKFNPDITYFVLEGYPQWRHEISKNYKVSRTRIEDDSFRKEKRKIIEMMTSLFPITVARHPDQECDDVIGNLIWKDHVDDDCVIVSTDSDFIQMINNPKVKLYNPIKKSYTSYPNYDYVTWKALRGDGADDIEGFPGIGDKRAELLVTDPEKLDKFLSEGNRIKKFHENLKLINFTDIQDMNKINFSSSTSNWDEIEKTFLEFGFHSMVSKPKTWKKYKDTFISLENFNDRKIIAS